MNERRRLSLVRTPTSLVVCILSTSTIHTLVLLASITFSRKFLLEEEYPYAYYA